MQEINIKKGQSQPKREDDVIINNDFTVETEKVMDFKSIIKNNHTNLLIGFGILGFIIFLVILLTNGKTLEDIRQDNLKQYKEVYNLSIEKEKQYLKLSEIYNNRAEKALNCIKQNSITGTVVDCNLDFNK